MGKGRELRGAIAPPQVLKILLTLGKRKFNAMIMNLCLPPQQLLRANVPPQPKVEDDAVESTLTIVT
jgi:hypothetical protein